MIAKNGRRGRERKSEGEKKKFFKKPAVEQEPKTLACGKRQVTRTASFTLRTERGGGRERGGIFLPVLASSCGIFVDRE
jgi:hypothetical protein